MIETGSFECAYSFTKSAGGGELYAGSYFSYQLTFNGNAIYNGQATMIHQLL